MGDLKEIYKLLELSDNKKLIDIINEKKNELNLNDSQLSKMLSIDKSTFGRLIKNIQDGNVENLDFYHVLKICQFFNININEMSQLYVASMKQEYIAELELARKGHFIVKNFDVKALKDFGFIESNTDIEGIEKRIVNFFGLNSIFEYNADIGAVLFSRSKNSSHDKMRDFWVRSAHFQFEKINNPNDYNREELELLIPKIRNYTRSEEKGMITVLRALYNVGVTVIVQKYLTKTQVMGGTFVVNNKPCIVLTDYNKRYPIIWTALLHELYHVLYDFEDLKTWKYHLSGESDVYLMREEDANFFAQEILFSQEKMDFIKHLIKSPLIVSDFAEKNRIHPSLIYYFYCIEHEKTTKQKVWGLYSNFMPSSEKVLKIVESKPYNKQSIAEEIELIKLKLITQ